MTVSRSFAVGEVPAAPQDAPVAADACEVVLVEMRAAEVQRGHVLSSGDEVLDARWRDGLRVLDVGRDRRWVLAPDHKLWVRS